MLVMYRSLATSWTFVNRSVRAPIAHLRNLPLPRLFRLLCEICSALQRGHRKKSLVIESKVNRTGTTKAIVLSEESNEEKEELREEEQGEDQRDEEDEKDLKREGADESAEEEKDEDRLEQDEEERGLVRGRKRLHRPATSY